jgi:hypothetical protein
MIFLWVTYEFAINVFENFLLYFFLKSFFEIKNERKFVIVSAIILQSSLLQLLNIYFGVGNFQSFIIIICFILFICFRNFNCKLRDLVFLLLFYFVILGTFDFFGVSAISILYDISPSEIEKHGKLCIFR